MEVEFVYRENAYVDDPAASGVATLGIAGPFRGRRDSFALAWAPTGEGKQWRILHRQRVDHGTWEEGDWYWDESASEPVDVRPLIETPTVTRLGLDDALAKLVEAIGSKVPTYIQETPIEGELHVSDQSRPEGGTGPWGVYFHKGRCLGGQDMESVSGYRRYDTWAEVLELVQRLVDPEVSLDTLPRSFALNLKVPVRVLRELNLM
jgi:hypothetical protein